MGKFIGDLDEGIREHVLLISLMRIMSSFLVLWFSSC